MVQVDYNHDKQFLEVNSQYVDLIQRKMFYPFIDNPGLHLLVQGVLWMSNSIISDQSVNLKKEM